MTNVFSFQGGSKSHAYVWEMDPPEHIHGHLLGGVHFPRGSISHATTLYTYTIVTVYTVITRGGGGGAPGNTPGFQGPVFKGGFQGRHPVMHPIFKGVWHSALTKLGGTRGPEECGIEEMTMGRGRRMAGSGG